MVTLNYVKKANKLYVGYCFFNNSHVFTTATRLDMLAHNMRLQFIKNKLPTKGVRYQLTAIDDVDLPYAHMTKHMHSRIQKRELGIVKPYKRSKLPVFEAPEKDDFIPAKDDDTVQYMERDGKLVVYKIIAIYSL